MTGHVSIDRLVLHVPGLNADEARRLARMVGAGLAASRVEAPAPDRAASGPLRLKVKAPDDKDLGRLAEAISAEILRSLFE
jgi:hypothetical protein